MNQSIEIPAAGHQPAEAEQSFKAETTPAVTPTTMTLTSSTGMMENYLQSYTTPAVVKLEALQKADGHALIFHQDNDDVLWALNEQSGVGPLGWTPTQLTSSGGGDVFLRTFSVSQSALDGTISLAIASAFAVNDDSDLLSVSLGNSSTDLSWIGRQGPQANWKDIPFDGQDQGGYMRMANIMFTTEAFGNPQYLIVDIVWSFSDYPSRVIRYYVNPSAQSGQKAWQQHDFPIPPQLQDYQSKVGRRCGDVWDGVYTNITNVPNCFAYLTLSNNKNPYDPDPYPVRGIRFDIGPVSAFATVRYRDHIKDCQGTDLYACTDAYAICGSSLFCVPANDQSAQGQPLLTDPLLAGTTDLKAMMVGNLLVLWAKNGTGVVYYMSCPIDALPQVKGPPTYGPSPPPSPWYLSLPILNNVADIATFINTADGGNTIFAFGANVITQLIQDATCPSQIWRANTLKLPAPPLQPSVPYTSYTTTVHVTDSNNQIVNTSLQLSANTRAPCYVNGLYHVLTPVPTTLATDSSGTITIVEAANGINGTILTVALEGATSITIDPQDASFQSLASLNTNDTLLGASKVTNAVAGGTLGPIVTGPLVPQPNGASPPSDELTAVTQNLSNLQTIYTPLHSPAGSSVVTASPHAKFERTALHMTYNDGVSHAELKSMSIGSFFGGIEKAFGDIVQHIKNFVKAVVKVVVKFTASIEQDAKNVWHFVTQIGTDTFSAVLADVHAVVGALEWVYDRVATGIEDIIQYLQMLFNWDNIKRTKDVMYNLTKIYLANITSDFAGLQANFDSATATAEADVNTWAGVSDWSSLGTTTNGPVKSNSSDAAKNQTSKSQLLSHHFRNNYSHAGPSADTKSDPGTGLMGALTNAVNQEEAALSTAITQFKTLADSITGLPDFATLIKGVAAIFADGVLSSTQAIVDAVFNILKSVGGTFLDVLDATLTFPVISDIFAALKIPPLSFLDIFTWIAAVGYTVVYELANDGNPPFPDNAATTSLINATSLSDLTNPASSSAQTKSLSTSPANIQRPHAATDKTRALAAASSSLDPSLASEVFSACHSTTAILEIIGAFLFAAEATFTTADNPCGKMSAILGLTIACLPAVGDYLCPKDPIVSTDINEFSLSITIATACFKLLCSGPFITRLTPGDPNKARMIGAEISAYLCLPKMFCSGWHFYELSSAASDKTRTTAIIGEVGNLLGDASTMLYSTAVNDPDPDSRGVTVVILAANWLAISGVQFAEAIVGSS